jgi:hypothetical protein
MSDANQKCVNWLLNSSHPSIRYLTKINLLKHPPTESDHQCLTASGSPIAQILHEIQDNRYWIHENHFYSPKYVSSHWSLLMLHEYACPADVPQVRSACLHLLTLSHKHWLSSINEKDNYNHELSCFFGNVVRYCTAFGLGDHPYTQDMLQFLSENKAGQEWCCIYNGHMPCLWGAVRSLYAFGIIPQNKRTDPLNQSIQSALQMVHNCAEMLTADTRSPSPKEHTVWAKLNFPLYYQTDKLFTLRVLQEHKQLQNEKYLPVLRWLQAQRKSDGTWRGRNPYKSRSWSFAMQSEVIHQWVSMFALSILVDAGLEEI